MGIESFSKSRPTHILHSGGNEARTEDVDRCGEADISYR
jgi:hypothetical protein